MIRHKNGIMPFKTLGELFKNAPQLELDAHTPLLVLSDLHMGNGKHQDDFRHNGALLVEALADYYWPKGYTLVLNGDIEELLRNERSAIMAAWAPLYELFTRFHEAARLVWLRGNHEIVPAQEEEDPRYFPANAVRFTWQGKNLFIFHGHQAGWVNSGRYNRVIGFVLRVFANKLGIGNSSVAHDSAKRFKLEKKVYDFSKQEGIISIIGHTHRPLFESLSKAESLGYQIEKMCREYARAKNGKRELIESTIGRMKRDYLKKPSRKSHRLVDNLYGEILVPCLFNAGCAIGKSGVTSLEIKKGRISLVYWSNKDRSRRFMEFNEYKPATMLAGGTWRFILRREDLHYLFSRIKLLK